MFTDYCVLKLDGTILITQSDQHNASQPASINFFTQRIIFFPNKSSVELKTERITDKLSCHQHIIWTYHPLSLSMLNVGVIQSRQAEKNCLLGLLLVFNLERYHNDHDLHSQSLQLCSSQSPLRFVLAGWYCVFPAQRGRVGHPS